jgi:hypothetical protein
MMESLKLVTEKRNSLFFGKYQYRAKCKVNGAVYTYYTKTLEEFKTKMAKKAENPPSYTEVLLSNWRIRIDLIDYDQIGKYFDWRETTPRDKYMSRIQGNSISFFSDDLELLKSLDVLDENLEISIADLIGNNVIYFKKEPEFKYRTYFRGKKAPDNFREEIQSFMDRYGNIASFCPALKRFINDMTSRRHWYRYLHSSYYVDYNDESTLTLLHMFFGSMLAKTYSLQKEP